MQTPLSKAQEVLRGRKRADMTEAQLLDWIDACNKMESWVGAAKARRTWKAAREDAEQELSRRALAKGRIG